MSQGLRGRGATCAFTTSYLNAHGERTGCTQKVGLYNSPHLKCVQERIQINSNLISEGLFTVRLRGSDRVTARSIVQPRYLQLLMLVGTHTYIRESVDDTIYRTHQGGEHDVTKIFPRPVFTGISTIGLDLVEQLGPSTENIA